MKTINLKDYYPYYTKDTYVEVPDELVTFLDACNKAESAYERQKYRYKVQYSLDCNDGIEHDIMVRILWGMGDKILLLYTQTSELENDLLKMARSVEFIE